MKNRAINALIKMGMPADLKGFRYIVDTMCLFEHEGWRCAKTTALYQKIGEINDETASRVERAMRHAFSVVITRGHLETVEKYLSFYNTPNGNLLHVFYLRLKQEEEKENGN